MTALASPEPEKALHEACCEFIDRRLFPGCAVATGSDSGPPRFLTAGRLTYDPKSDPVASRTWFDLASLTKPIATTTAALLESADGRLDLDAPLGRFFPGMRNAEARVRHLLTHSSGFPAHRRFFETCSGPEQVLEEILQAAPEYPPGTQSVYSDVGFILLGRILERVSGMPFVRLVEERVLASLGLTQVRFGSPSLRETAPTELDFTLHGFARGIVHDENARLFGGKAPHAGLFGTLEGVADFAGQTLRAVVLGSHSTLPAADLRHWTRSQNPAVSSWGLGWDTATPESSAGPSMGPLSFGHTGFTGTSIWIDPEQQRFVCILSNRVYPSRRTEGIKEARRRLNSLALRLAG